MLSTDKQTNRQTNQRYQKHNLFCQVGKNKDACTITLHSKFIAHILVQLYRSWTFPHGSLALWPHTEPKTLDMNLWMLLRADVVACDHKYITILSIRKLQTSYKPSYNIYQKFISVYTYSFKLTHVLQMHGWMVILGFLDLQNAPGHNFSWH